MKLKRYPYYLLILFLNFAISAAQTLNNEGALQSDFEDFVQNEAFAPPPLKAPYFAYTIPQKVFVFNNNGQDFVIGVSDQTTDTIIALQQAIWRARCMAALQNGCWIQSQSNFYSSELSGGGLSNKHIMLSILSKDTTTTSPRIKVLEKYRTDFYETIVIASVEKKPGPPIRFEGELFLSETSRRNHVDLNQRISTKSGEDQLSSNRLLYYLNHSKFRLETTFKKDKQPAIKTLCKYDQPGLIEKNNLELLSDGYSKASMIHGFWPAYAQALLRQLRNVSNDRMKSRKMNNIQNGLLSDLGDERTKTAIRFQAKKMYILNNTIYLKCYILDNIDTQKP